jgi:hypothetical protein
MRISTELSILGCEQATSSSDSVAWGNFGFLFGLSVPLRPRPPGVCPENGHSGWVCAAEDGLEMWQFRFPLACLCLSPEASHCMRGGRPRQVALRSQKWPGSVPAAFFLALQMRFNTEIPILSCAQVILSTDLGASGTSIFCVPDRGTPKKRHFTKWPPDAFHFQIQKGHVGGQEHALVIFCLSRGMLVCAPKTATAGVLAPRKMARQCSSGMFSCRTDALQFRNCNPWLRRAI